MSDLPVTCPACGHKQPLAEECARCGVVFAKYRRQRLRIEEPLGPLTPGRAALVLLLTLCVGLAAAAAIVFPRQRALRSSEAWTAARAYLHEHPALRLHLGQGATPGKWITGRLADDHASLNARLRGPEGSGRVRVRLELDHRWRVVGATLRTPGGDVLRLDGESQPRAEEPAPKPAPPTQPPIATDERGMSADELRALPDALTPGTSQPSPHDPFPNLSAVADALESPLVGSPMQAESVTTEGMPGWYQGAEGHERALAERDERRLPLVVYFHADWCGFCRRFEQEFLPAPELRQLLAGALRVEVLPERSEPERELALEYGVKGYPSFFVLAGEGDGRTRVHPFLSGSTLSASSFAAAVAKAAGVEPD